MTGLMILSHDYRKLQALSLDKLPLSRLTFIIGLVEPSTSKQPGQQAAGIKASQARNKDRWRE